MCLRGKKVRVFILLLTIFIVLLVFLSANVYVSYNCLKKTIYEIESDKIENTVTLCLMSDLHDHRFGDKNSRLVKAVQEIQPDLILMDGDMINEESEDTSVATEIISRCIEIAPVYYSLGNQEKEYLRAGASDLIKELTKAGAVVLEDAYTSVEINENRICLAGMYAYAFAEDGSGHMDKDGIDPERLQLLEDFQAQDCFKIMMAHRPDSFIFGDAADTWEIDLVVSGHLHGGQVIIPFAGGLYAGDQGFFPEYVYGEHHFDAVKTMIITSGLGSDRERLPRFNNLPEIVVITLKSE